MTSKDYTKTKWHGLPAFQCKHCPYSSLELAEMQEHWNRRHAPPPPPPPRVVQGVTDRYGNPIVVEAQASDEPPEAPTPAPEPKRSGKKRG